jgi:hypothetical protein
MHHCLTPLDLKLYFNLYHELETRWTQSKLRYVPPAVGVRRWKITDQGVTIGEAENIAKLTHAEWNDLVARVRSGELREVLLRSSLS